MPFKHEKFYIAYIFWLLIFVFFTNQYYDFNEIVSINQHDSISYMAIAKSAPYFSNEEIAYHHAQRVFFPYLIGLISNFFKIDIMLSFRIGAFIVVFTIVLFHYIITKILKTNLYVSLVFVSLLILNPYLIRYFIAVPTMVNDAAFILSLYLFLFGLVLNNSSTLIGVFFGLISRQNGIFLFAAFLIEKFFVLKYKLIKDKSVIASILILLIISFTANNYAKHVSLEGFDFRHAYGIFDWLAKEFNLLYFLKWAILPFYSYFPALIIIVIFFNLKSFDKSILKDYIVLLFIFFSIIGISYLPGPQMAGRNIIRQTSLAYPVILVGGLWFMSVKKKFFNKSLLILIIILLHIWSFHPRYSKINTFEFLRNYFF